MTPEEINRAIAESLGYHDLHTSPQGHLYGKSPEDTTLRFRLPDYHSDLNAMHGAEKTLKSLPETPQNDMLRKRYRQTLDEICRKTGWDYAHQTWHATAPQRAEAFLRALGKWKD